MADTGTCGPVRLCVSCTVYSPKWIGRAWLQAWPDQVSGFYPSPACACLYLTVPLQLGQGYLAPVETWRLRQ